MLIQQQQKKAVFFRSSISDLEIPSSVDEIEEGLCQMANLSTNIKIDPKLNTINPLKTIYLFSLKFVNISKTNFAFH